MIILFDSPDGRYHNTEKEIKDLIYFEYCEIGFDGQVTIAGARKSKTKVIDLPDVKMRPGRYRIEACRFKDHALIKIPRNNDASVTAAIITHICCCSICP